MKTHLINIRVQDETVRGEVRVQGLTGEREDEVLKFYEKADQSAHDFLAGTPTTPENIPTQFEVKDDLSNAAIEGAVVRIVGNFNGTQITNSGGWCEFIIPKPGSEPFSVFVTKDGYDELQIHGFPWDGRPHQAGGEFGTLKLQLKKKGAPVVERRGATRLDGRLLVDDLGSFNALGASMFAIPWLLEFEPERGRQNLEFAADWGVHAPRILCVNGPAEPWADRTQNPKTQGWSRWEQMIKQTLLTLRGYKQRAILTIFGGTDLLDRTERQRVVSVIRQLITQHREQVLYVEVSNEMKVSNEEAVEHAKMLRVGNPNLIVALTAFTHNGGFADPSANMHPCHHPRKITGDGGVWDYTEQPYKTRDLTGNSDQEGIGDKTSVASDPGAGGDHQGSVMRQASLGLTSMITGASVVVLHTGAGVFMGGSGGHAMGREANLYDVPRITELLRAKTLACQRLYQDVVSFGNITHSNPDHEGNFPWKTEWFQPYDAAHWFLKVYACRHGGDGRFAANFMAVKEDIVLEPFTGKQEIHLYSADGKAEDHFTLDRKLVLTGWREGFYIVGRQV